MSHGSTEKCEPNMTPLLDLVLQLVMFFMICTNFVTEQTSAGINLPEAIAAKPLEKNVNDVIYLNVFKDGKVEIGKDKYDNVATLRSFMDRFYGDPTTTKPRKALTVIILRADQECEFIDVYNIMLQCRLVGYETVQFRAILNSGGPTPPA